MCAHAVYGDIILDIIGIDQDTPADSAYTHSITVQCHNAFGLGNIPYITNQAFWYNSGSVELEPGEYYVTAVNGVSYSFTTTQPIPVGGQMVFADTSFSAINIYASNTDTEPIETVATITGTIGTFLGSEYTVHTDMSLYGNSNWKEAYMRTFLNSTNESSSYVATSGFDRPPVTDIPGFLVGLDSDIKDVMGEVSKQSLYRDASTGEVSIVNTDDKVFLLSRAEVYGGDILSQHEGTPYQYYIDNTSLTAPGLSADECRMRTENDVAVTHPLRTPLVGTHTRYDGINVHYISSESGAISNMISAESSKKWSIAPAWCIV